MVARLAGVLLLVLGLLPIANWIPGGHEAPWYGERMALWTSGGAILAGVLVVSAIVFRRRPALWREGLWAGVASRWLAGGWRADIGIALVACIAYAMVSQLVFSASPLHIDEIIQVWQARVFASGRLWVPSPDQPEFTAVLNLVDYDGRRFGQFPAGGPAMLMIGTVLRAEWLVGPAFAALAVLVFARLVRRTEVRPGVALAAVLLFGFCPFWLFFAGSRMNHVFATTWLLAAAMALAVAVQDRDARWRAALLCGLALGVAATIRPMDAIAFALPTAAWLLWRARLGWSHVAALFASGAGVALPLVALLYVNAQQTGNPLLFGYELLWGNTVGIGFHDAPWGTAHTPLRGVELVNLYLLRLQSHLFETPAPALLFATVALLLAPRLTSFDRWVLSSSALLVLSYWAYWHDGFYLGPRFLLPLAPWLVLWTVRLPAVLRDREVAPWLGHGVVSAGVLGLLIGGALLVPIRADRYAISMDNLRVSLDSLVKAEGAVAGTVLLREMWGSQLVAGMWGLGVDPSAAEAIYRTTDACALDAAIVSTRLSGGRTGEFMAAVAPARQDSSLLMKIEGAADTTLRREPGRSWRAECQQRLMEDQQGFAVFPPAMLAGRQGGPRFVRDLHRQPPGTEPPYYLLRKPTEVGAPYQLTLLPLDSLNAAWGGAR